MLLGTINGAMSHHKTATSHYDLVICSMHTLIGRISTDNVHTIGTIRTAHHTVCRVDEDDYHEVFVDSSMSEFRSLLSEYIVFQHTKLWKNKIF